jgi:cytoplasmic iron level regulating protein YaaA (DUF328/UPF0246 family)
MLILISPAKTIDIPNDLDINIGTPPEFIYKAEVIVEKLKQYSVDELMDLMGISHKLAVLNEQRFKQWQNSFSELFSKQAVCAFKGEVYTGINVRDWNKDDFNFAQNHLRIISGLYGLLRPLDYIRAYRLEMNTKIDIGDADNLYKFWQEEVTNSVNRVLAQQQKPVLINLASNEYFKTLKMRNIQADVITPVFKDFKNGNYKTISIYLKKARGLMSSFIIRNRLSNIEQIKEFTADGYSYNDRLTKGNEWVFTRD